MVESDEDDEHMGFSGLPTPAAAAAVASFAFLMWGLRREDTKLLFRTDVDGRVAALEIVIEPALPARVSWAAVPSHSARTIGSVRGWISSWRIWQSTWSRG